MRTKKELKGKEFNDDMSELKELLEKEGIKHTFKKHSGADPKLKTLIGYYPTGEWHIKVDKESIIRGMGSYGDYEIWNPEVDNDPIIFKTAQEMLKEIKKRLYKDKNRSNIEKLKKLLE